MCLWVWRGGGSCECAYVEEYMCVLVWRIGKTIRFSMYTKGGLEAIE